MIDGTTCVGTVAALWRYPVKSMQGEEVTTAAISERGVFGDRAYAIMDRATGHIASAKHPRKWARVVQCCAAFVEPPRPGTPLPPISITLPDGTIISSADADVDQVLSRALGRDVTLLATAPAHPTREANRAPVDSAPDQELILEEEMATAAPPGTFFDYAPLHLLATTTLARLQELYPDGRFEVARFRPNIVVAPPGDERDFVENRWLGRRLVVGAAVELDLIDPCPRCVITTLAQGDLPHDPGILRTVARHNTAASVTLAPGAILSAVVGAYARVLQGGTLQRGDPVWLGESVAAAQG